MARTKHHRIDDPVGYFSGWAFSICPEHWPALGVRQRIKSQTGEHEHALTTPVAHEFHVGDLFYAIANNGFLQVVALINHGYIEVHSGIVGMDNSRRAFAILPSDLAEWLRTGQAPAGARPVTRGTSRAGLLSWLIPA